MLHALLHIWALQNTTGRKEGNNKLIDTRACSSVGVLPYPIHAGLAAAVHSKAYQRLQPMHCAVEPPALDSPGETVALGANQGLHAAWQR